MAEHYESENVPWVGKHPYYYGRDCTCTSDIVWLKFPNTKLQNLVAETLDSKNPVFLPQARILHFLYYGHDVKLSIKKDEIDVMLTLCDESYPPNTYITTWIGENKKPDKPTHVHEMSSHELTNKKVKYSYANEFTSTPEFVFVGFYIFL